VSASRALAVEHSRESRKLRSFLAVGLRPFSLAKFGDLASDFASLQIF